MERAIGIFILMLFVCSVPFAGLSAQPQIGFEELLLDSEYDSQQVQEARNLAMSNGYPVSIYLPDEGVLIEALGVENNEPVYGIITNLAHPFQDGGVAFYQDVSAQYDLSDATINYGGGNIIRERRQGTGEPRLEQGLAVILIPESSNERVMSFDPITGDLVDMDFIPPHSEEMATPIQARLTPWGNITISDQTRNEAHHFDLEGNYLGPFAPAGGANTDIMQNLRGHAYRENGNLLVTSASGGNANSIVEFDTDGEFIGLFVAPDDSPLNGPWSIWYRENDILMTGSSTPSGAYRFDFDGEYIAEFAAITSFPQQVVEIQDNYVAIANFSPGAESGVRVYTPDGQLVDVLSGVTGNRGVWQLGNGNFLTTNSGGVHEIDGETGELIRTVVSGVSARHTSFLIPDDGDGVFNVNPESIDFGEVYIGQSASEELTVSNDGEGTLFVTSVSSSHPAFTVTPTSGIIAPDDELIFTVTFTPMAIDNYEADITFNHNAEGSPHVVEVWGEGNVDPDAPFIAVDPEEIESMLEAGETGSALLTIHNDGNTDLDFWIDTQTLGTAGFISIPQSDGDFPMGQYEPSAGLPPADGQPTVDPSAPVLSMDWLADAVYYGVEASNDIFVWYQGDEPEVLHTIGSYPGTGFSNAGDFPIDDDSYVYEIDNQGVLRTIDIETGEVTVLGTVGSDWTGMATDPIDGTFYLSTGTGLYTLDVDALSTTHIGNYGIDFMIALAIDGEGILYGYSVQTNNFYSIDKETAAITEIGFIGFDANFGQGMTWDSQHDQIVMAAFNQATFQPEFRIVDRNTGNTQLVGVLGSQVPGGLAQLGWIATPLDVTPPWLAVDPKEGTVAPGGSMEITVLFDGTELVGGFDYLGELQIGSNDPLTPVVDVPVTLTVTGDPAIAVEPDALDFGDIFVGTENTMDITVTNDGNAVLEVTDIHIDHDNFWTDADVFTLFPGQSYIVYVTFNPQNVGEFEAVLTIENNDADVTVNLTGEGVPFLSMVPDFFDEELDVGEMITLPLEVTNEYIDDLPFSIYVQGVTDEEPMFYPDLVNEELLRWQQMHEGGGSTPQDPSELSVGRDPMVGQYGTTPAEGSMPLQSLLSAMNVSGYALDVHADEIVSFDIGVPEDITTLEDGMFTSYAGNFVRGNMDDIFMVNQDDFTLVKYNILTDGLSVIGELTGAVVEGETFTDLETDYTTGVVYLSSGSNLYELDYFSGELTHVGEYGEDYLMIAIAVDHLGVMYGHDISGDQIVTIDQETAEVTVVGPTGFTANFAQSMTFDHTTRQLLMAAYNVDVPFGQRNELRVVHRKSGTAFFVGHFYGDGSGEMGWFATKGEGFVSLNLISGILAAGATLDLDVTLDATHLLAGEYEANIAFVGEELVGQPSVDLPVTLTVHGEPELWVSDDALDFGEVFVNGTSGEQYLTLRNDGTDHLQVSNISIDHEYFHFDSETEFSLAPGEPRVFSLWFAPESENGFAATLTIESDGGTGEVALTGEGIPAPVATWDPESFEHQAYPGQVQEHTLNLGNIGGNPLEYEVVIGVENPASLDDYEILIEEYFDGDFPPEGWELTSTGANINWRQNNTSRAGGEAPEAEFYWSPSTTGLQRMITPVMDTGGLTEITLEFKHFINNFSSVPTYELRLEVSADGGESWDVLDSWPPENRPAQTEVYVLTEEHGIGSEEFRVAWVFEGNSFQINWWNVDDVLIYYEVVPWLSVAPMEGTVDPDMADEINITIDAEDLAPGTYESGLIFHTNDPVTPMKFVPFTLHVIESLVVSALPEEGDEEVHPNEEFTVPITVTSMDDLEVLSYQFTLEFDHTLLEPLEVITDGTLSEDAFVTVNLDEPGEVRVAAAYSPEGLESGDPAPVLFQIEGEGTLVYITFKAQEEHGTTALEFTEMMFNEGEPPASTVDGEVSVVPMYGDVSMNLGINAFDASLILQHSVYLIELSETQQVHANVSGGEGVSALDASLILRYVAGIIDQFPVTGMLLAGDDQSDLQSQAADMVSSGSGIISFESLERRDGSDMLSLPIVLNDAESVYSIELWAEFDDNLITIDNVRGDLPDGWIMYHNIEEGMLRVSFAGTDPLGSGNLGSLMLEIDDITAEATLSGEVMINEGSPDVIEMSVRDIPEEFKLTQNYPNPFNPVTTIQYQLPQDARVQLVIYNQLGQQVKTLVDEEQAAGYYRIQWDATNNAGMPVSSGMYIYRLQTGEFSDVKRMIFLK